MGSTKETVPAVHTSDQDSDMDMDSSKGKDDQEEANEGEAEEVQEQEQEQETEANVEKTTVKGKERKGKGHAKVIAILANKCLSANNSIFQTNEKVSNGRHERNPTCLLALLETAADDKACKDRDPAAL